MLSVTVKALGLQRSPYNPVLSPDLDAEWEEFAAFNGSVLVDGGNNTNRVAGHVSPKAHAAALKHAPAAAAAGTSDGHAHDKRGKHPHGSRSPDQPRVVAPADAVGPPPQPSAQRRFDMFYRAISSEREIDGHVVRVSSVGHCVSADGYEWTSRRVLLEPSEEWDRFGCEDPRVTHFEGIFYTFYTALGGFPFTAENVRVACAWTPSLDVKPKRHLVTPFNAKAMALFPERIGSDVCALVTIHTETPPSKVVLARARQVEDFMQESYWTEWYDSFQDHVIPIQRFNTDQIEVGAKPIRTDEGWLVLYAHIQNYAHTSAPRIFGIEAVLLDLLDPTRVIARTDEPLLVPEAVDATGTVPNVIFPSGGIVVDDELRLYYSSADTYVCVATAPLRYVLGGLTRAPAFIPKGRKNLTPLFTTAYGATWESQCVFNAAVFDDGRVVRMLYRAQGPDWTSVLGYAEMNPPDKLVHRGLDPVYVPRADFEKPARPGFSGCEDPRLTKIGDRMYMLYTAYRGEGPPRVAITDIDVQDFLRERWDKWTFPRLITNPNEMNKDAALFPEPINDKFWIIHRVEPDICLDTRDSLEFNGTSDWLETKHRIRPELRWEGPKIGANAPPLKTSQGWLLLYHGTGSPTPSDRCYRMGVMLLDLYHPERVLARGRYPIIEPELSFEQFGFVPNVCFSCGWVRRGDHIWIYYGGADTAIGVVKFSQRQLLEFLLGGVA